MTHMTQNTGVQSEIKAFIFNPKYIVWCSSIGNLIPLTKGGRGERSGGTPCNIPVVIFS